MKRLLEKNICKVVISGKVVMPKKIPKSTQSFNFYFFADIKDPYINKTYEKSCLILHTYNIEKKNFILNHISKIPKISQGIGFYLTVIS